ncbi:MAG: hypothetical protein FWE59_01990 [Oscillospiraceae bacterium]|nr:hypothetical protein [Oscillospiraceae bacterium]
MNNKRCKRRTQWIAILLSALFALSALFLLAGCDGDGDGETNTPDQPTDTGNGENSDAPPVSNDPENSDAPPVDPSSAPSSAPVRETTAPLNYPDIGDLEKDVHEAVNIASYYDENITLQIYNDPATEEQLREAGQAWGDQLEALFLDRVVSGTVSGSKTIELAGFNCTGIELEATYVFEGYAYYVVIIPAGKQLVTVTGTAVEEFALDLREAFDQLVQSLSL